MWPREGKDRGPRTKGLWQQVSSFEPQYMTAGTPSWNQNKLNLKFLPIHNKKARGLFRASWGENLLVLFFCETVEEGWKLYSEYWLYIFVILYIYIHLMCIHNKHTRRHQMTIKDLGVFGCIYKTVWVDCSHSDCYPLSHSRPCSDVIAGQRDLGSQ